MTHEAIKYNFRVDGSNNLKLGVPDLVGMVQNMAFGMGLIEGYKKTYIDELPTSDNAWLVSREGVEGQSQPQEWMLYTDYEIGGEKGIKRSVLRYGQYDGLNGFSGYAYMICGKEYRGVERLKSGILRLKHVRKEIRFVCEDDDDYRAVLQVVGLNSNLRSFLADNVKIVLEANRQGTLGVLIYQDGNWVTFPGIRPISNQNEPSLIHKLL